MKWVFACDVTACFGARLLRISFIMLSPSISVQYFAPNDDDNFDEYGSCCLIWVTSGSVITAVVVSLRSKPYSPEFGGDWSQYCLHAWLTARPAAAYCHLRSSLAGFARFIRYAPVVAGRNCKKLSRACFDASEFAITSTGSVSPAKSKVWCCSPRLSDLGDFANGTVTYESETICNTSHVPQWLFLCLIPRNRANVTQTIKQNCYTVECESKK